MSHIWPELSKIIPTVLLVSKALQLLMQYSCLFVLSNIQKNSQSLNHLLVHLMGQYLMHKQIFREVFLNFNLSFVWEVESYCTYDVITNQRRLC